MKMGQLQTGSSMITYTYKSNLALTFIKSICSTLLLNKFWLKNSSWQFIYRSEAILAKEQSAKSYMVLGSVVLEKWYNIVVIHTFIFVIQYLAHDVRRSMYSMQFSIIVHCNVSFLFLAILVHFSSAVKCELQMLL